MWNCEYLFFKMTPLRVITIGMYGYYCLMMAFHEVHSPDSACPTPAPNLQ